MSGLHDPNAEGKATGETNPDLLARLRACQGVRYHDEDGAEQSAVMVPASDHAEVLRALEARGPNAERDIRAAIFWRERDATQPASRTMANFAASETAGLAAEVAELRRRLANRG